MKAVIYSQNREEIKVIELGEDFIATNLKINLELAGIFYVNAWQNIIEGEKKYKKLENEIKKYQESYNNRLEKYSIDSEDFYVYQLSKIRELEVFYEPVITHFSIAKILLTCCAETYINEVASTFLKGKNLDEFDRLSILGKWIFSQDLLKFKKKLTLDKAPLQDFSQLIKERNKLIHFKGLPKSLKLLEIPDFLNDLKLTPDDCTKNYYSVKQLIHDFCIIWRGSHGPNWLIFDQDNSTNRQPCFYVGGRDIGMILHSDKLDKKTN